MQTLRRGFLLTGRGIGTLIGGAMFDSITPRTTYQVFAGISMAIGVIYALLHFFWLINFEDVSESYGNTSNTKGDHWKKDAVSLVHFNAVKYSRGQMRQKTGFLYRGGH